MFWRSSRRLPAYNKRSERGQSIESFESIGSFVRDKPLFVAMAVDRVAIFAGVAIVPDARIARMALTRLDRHKPFAAVWEPLELDGGERISCKNTAEDQSKSDESYLHFDTPMFSAKALHEVTSAENAYHAVRLTGRC